MKSIEIIVPRKLIIGFYPHPELYGDFIVELENGMITDVYYNEDHDFITITSEGDLIDYLNIQEILPTNYQYQNGVFAFRQISVEDKERLDSWNKIKPIRLEEFVPAKCFLSKEFETIPMSMIFTYYWIEVGVVKIIQGKDGINVILDIFEMSYLENSIQRCLLTKFDIEICMHIIKEYLILKLLS